MIVNFGSLNIDYVYSVKNFVKPGETILCTGYNVYAGGKGLNQSVAAGRAGGRVRHAGMIGEEGRFLLDILNDAHVDSSLVKIVGERNGHTVIQVDQNGQNSIILYGGTNHMLDADYAELVAGTLSKGDIVLFQNETSANSDLMKLAAEKECVIALNPSPMDDRIRALPLELVSIFILNEIEGGDMTGRNDPAEILYGMALRFPKAKILLTLGKAGMRFTYGKNQFEEGIFEYGSVVDTTAAGDTFTGYYLAAVSRGIDDREAVRQATAASGICVTRAGAAQSIPFASEVRAALDSGKFR